MFYHIEDTKKHKMQEAMGPNNDGLRKGGQ